MCALITSAPIDYLVIGHIACDIIPGGLQMGGTAAYASLTAQALGLRVGVVTSWGAEIPLGPLNTFSMTVTPSKHSTTFENIYQHQNRVQILHHKAEDLSMDCIPNSWLSAPIVHLGPIAQEVDPSLASEFQNSFVGVTPQGWMRSWDQKGRIRPTKWAKLTSVLKYAQAVVISIEDIANDENIVQEMASSCPILAVTEGKNGARVYWHGDVRRFSAPQQEEIDATGAGDIFAAAFFAHLHKTRDPWEAARFVNTLASQSVTRQGLTGVPTVEEIENAIVEVF